MFPSCFYSHLYSTYCISDVFHSWFSSIAENPQNCHCLLRHSLKLFFLIWHSFLNCCFHQLDVKGLAHKIHQVFFYLFGFYLNTCLFQAASHGQTNHLMLPGPKYTFWLRTSFSMPTLSVILKLMQNLLTWLETQKWICS